MSAAARETLSFDLYQKAKRHFWDPRAIDFAEDTRDWRRLTELEQRSILQLTSLFLGGEESVMLGLLPLIMVIADEWDPPALAAHCGRSGAVAACPDACGGAARAGAAVRRGVVRREDGRRYAFRRASRGDGRVATAQFQSRMRRIAPAV